jgi:solute carrier family 35, member F1/2
VNVLQSEFSVSTVEQMSRPLLTSHTLWVLLRGQWISVLIAGTGIFATILSNAHPNANFPLFMNMFNYLLLSMFLFRSRCRNWLFPKDDKSFLKLNLDDIGEHSVDREANMGHIDNANNDNSQGQVFPDGDSASSSIKSIFANIIKGEDHDGVRVNKLLYLLAAFLDVEANFLVLLAYNYTSITSVMMLDCFTIPCAMGLSYFFLGCRYTWKHVGGTCICLIGLICIVLNDAINDNGESRSTLVGDLFCLSSAVLYAASNVIQETVVKFHDRDQFLGHLGLLGAGIALIQFLATDLQRVHTAHFTVEIIFSMVGFILCLFFVYINTTAYLQESDSTLFNLSLLTSDVYAVIFSYFFYGSLVNWLYFVAFGLVIVGLTLYHSEQAPLKVGEEKGSESNAHKILTLGGSNDVQRSKRNSSLESSPSSRLSKVGIYAYNPILDDSIDRAVVG